MIAGLENFLTPEMSRLLTTNVLPFLIFFGVLAFAFRKTGIFGHNNLMYVFFSLALTAILKFVNPGGVFETLAGQLVKFGVAGAVISLLGVGALIFYTVIKTGVKFAENFKTDEQKLKDLDKSEKKLLDRYNSHGLFGSPSVGERNQIDKMIEELTKQRRYLMAKMKRHV